MSNSFQYSDYYGDYYGENIAMETPTGYYEESADHAQMHHDEEYPAPIPLSILAWGIVPLVDTALGYFFMDKQKDVSDKWNYVWYSQYAVGGISLLSWGAALFGSASVFLYGSLVSLLGQAANIYLIYAANSDHAVSTDNLDLYGYAGSGFAIALSLLAIPAALEWRAANSTLMSEESPEEEEEDEYGFDEAEDEN